MPVSTDQTENKNGLASDNASPLKLKKVVKEMIEKERQREITIIQNNPLPDSKLDS